MNRFVYLSACLFRNIKIEPFDNSSKKSFIYRTTLLLSSMCSKTTLAIFIVSRSGINQIKILLSWHLHTVAASKQYVLKQIHWHVNMDTRSLSLIWQSLLISISMVMEKTGRRRKCIIKSPKHENCFFYTTCIAWPKENTVTLQWIWLVHDCEYQSLLSIVINHCYQ